jgi:hypothetical protein
VAGAPMKTTAIIVGLILAFWAGHYSGFCDGQRDRSQGWYNYLRCWHKPHADTVTIPWDGVWFSDGGAAPGPIFNDGESSLNAKDCNGVGGNDKPICNGG